MRFVYLITYDICEPKRLRRVFKILNGFGDHVQFSVFWCELSEIESVLLKEKLDKVINHKEDQVLFFKLGLAESNKTIDIVFLGLKYAPPEHKAIII